MTAIHDKHGRKYRITECSGEHVQRFNIEHRGIRIGYANFHFQGADVLHLDDLHLEDDAIMPAWFALDLYFGFVAFPPLRWRTRNFRNRGIGTAMIKFLAEYAQSKFASRIEGEVKHHDFKDNPDLPEWYRRRGFAVVMDDGKMACVAKISMPV